MQYKTRNAATLNFQKTLTLIIMCYLQQHEWEPKSKWKRREGHAHVSEITQAWRWPTLFLKRD